MNRILVVDCKDSFVYNIIELLRQEGREYSVIDVEDISIPLVSDFSAAILSPGGGVPEEYPNLLRFVEYYHQKIPLLGVCLGHQSICGFFSAELYQIERPLHGYAAPLIINNICEPIFNGVPNMCNVGLYHSWAVRCSADSPLEVIALDERGVVMAIKHKALPIYGVQFHPESIITGDNGRKMLKNWFEIVDKDLVKIVR